jgi:thiamine transport system permease protein
MADGGGRVTTAEVITLSRVESNCLRVSHAAAPLTILAAILLGIIPLVLFATTRGGSILPDPSVWRITGFTLWQATVSMLLSIIPAIPVARALARQRFPAQRLIVAGFAVPLSFPVIVALFGITTLYGNNGLFPGVIGLYGLPGIIFVHVFFNLPLAVRLLLEALHSSTAEAHRLAEQLGFSERDVWRHIDWPAMKPALPRIASLVFLLCAASFVVVLTLGGPGATTLEVAIYQSLRLDFDVTRALTLSLIQVAMSFALVLAASQALTMPATQQVLRTAFARRNQSTMTAKLFDAAAIFLACLLVFPPLLCVAIAGLGHIELTSTLATALLTSFAIGTLSSLIAIPLAWGTASAQVRLPRWRKALMTIGLGGYLVPPAVLSTGWFLAFRKIEGGMMQSALLIATMNALMALPFLLTVITPALQRSFSQNDRLCAQLGIAGLNRLLHVDGPSMRPALAQAVLMAFVLSMGDLTAVTLLGVQGMVTLPSLVQQQMGHYQSNAAGGTAVVLAVLCLGLTIVSQRLSRWT